VSWSEEALVVPCEGDQLVGVLAVPERPAARGVLIVVGGPQYRAGSHRQFTLLARRLAQAGIASLRFDYRGMGDSSGASHSYEDIEDDIRSAVDVLVERVPSVQEVVIWGLCGAASAALFYAHTDRRIGGLVLVNPWVRTEAGLARARLRHYYGARLLQPQFWLKILHGELNPFRAMREFIGYAIRSLGGGQATFDGLVDPVPVRMEAGLRRFKGPVLVVLSGKDLTAQEFRDVAASSSGWRALLDNVRVTKRELVEANHTFSRREWRDQLADWTADWVKQP
jgi:exosortase A-associated hydrolase 1